MTKIVQEAGPKILEAIKASKNVLLTCHPSPDGDSVGSTMAMKLVLEKMGKKVTAIHGDNEIPVAFMHFPGADTIQKKNFFEIDLGDFDLFIIQDMAALDRVSRKGEVKLPSYMKVIVIDHHDTTMPYAGLVNLIDPSYPSTTAMLYDLFVYWKVELTPEIAANLFIGTYTDTGGFKYSKTWSETFEMAAKLTRLYPDFSHLILTMENGRSQQELISLGLLLSRITTHLDGHMAIASLSNLDMITSKLSPDDVSTSWTSSLLRSVTGWDISACSLEISPGVVKTSFRSRDENKFDLSKLAVALGGGGHKAAAGAILTMPLDKAIEKIVQTAKEIYNL